MLNHSPLGEAPPSCELRGTHHRWEEQAIQGALGNQDLSFSGQGGTPEPSTKPCSGWLTRAQLISLLQRSLIPINLATWQVCPQPPTREVPSTSPRVFPYFRINPYPATAAVIGEQTLQNLILCEDGTFFKKLLLQPMVPIMELEK